MPRVARGVLRRGAGLCKYPLCGVWVQTLRPAAARADPARVVQAEVWRLTQCECGKEKVEWRAACSECSRKKLQRYQRKRALEKISRKKLQARLNKEMSA